MQCMECRSEQRVAETTAAPPRADAERGDAPHRPVSHPLREGENEARDSRRRARKKPQRGGEATVRSVIGNANAGKGVRAGSVFGPFEEHAPVVRRSDFKFDVGLANPYIAITGHESVLFEHPQALATDLRVPKPGQDLRSVDRPLVTERTPIEP